MTARPAAIGYHRIRAPREDGQALIEPSLADAVQWLKQAATRVHESGGVCAALLADGANSFADIDCLGRSLGDLSRSARMSLLSIATEYTGRYRDLDLSGADELSRRPIVLSGHQPTLFHPGVWFKNYALSTLAAKSGATAVNLIVDNDTIRSAGIRVPTGPVDSPLFENVAFDRATEEMPYEERSLLDAATFDSFGRRVEECFRKLMIGAPLPSYTPLVRRLWMNARKVRASHSEDASLGWIVAELRHRLEGELGLVTLEAPLSKLADTDDFRWFVACLLMGLPRFQQVYNDSLSEYRRVNHIRSRSHPAPDLATTDEWIEAPLWVWTSDRPQRRRLFSRRGRQSIEITDRAGFSATLSESRTTAGGSFVEQLRGLRQRGVKIRPRALITTMFARLLAGDVFLHGIGGAKYDELTDAIIQRFWGIAPPPYLTLTATLRLPIARPQLSIEDLRDHRRRLRDVRYHPERFEGEVPPDLRMDFIHDATRKRELVEQRWPSGSKAEWHRDLISCNERMAAALSGYCERLQAAQTRLAEQCVSAQRLGSRDFSFVLFPEETLPEQLRQMCETGPHEKITVSEAARG